MAQPVYLLDTNILLAAVIAPERLPLEEAGWLSSTANTVYFSSASIWEIALKCSLSRAGFDFLPEDIHRLALETGFTEKPVCGEDSYAVARMPWHHRDPFDRLLIAQAQSLPAYLLTTDGLLSQYSELVIHIELRYPSCTGDSMAGTEHSAWVGNLPGHAEWLHTHHVATRLSRYTTCRSGSRAPGRGSRQFRP